MLLRNTCCEPDVSFLSVICYMCVQPLFPLHLFMCVCVCCALTWRTSLVAGWLAPFHPVSSSGRRSPSVFPAAPSGDGNCFPPESRRTPGKRSSDRERKELKIFADCGNKKGQTDRQRRRRRQDNNSWYCTLISRHALKQFINRFQHACLSVIKYCVSI